MNSHLPKQPFKTLALSLSGGGYRAASFHLGLLTYLSSVKWEGLSLLERVRVISTVSGGTFTGACYASSLARGQSIDDCYEKLLRFMTDADLIREGLEKLCSYSHWHSGKARSLINAFSRVYFDRLEKDTFTLLLNNQTHLTEIIFNATEFTYGLPFRFQKCDMEEESRYEAYLGNRQVNMPPEALEEVRLSDVIAASSCFPMGFEPINFPDDFRHEHSPNLDALKESRGADQWGNRCEFPIGLMDGGIDDNQGIDSVIWAEKRMRNYKGELASMVSHDEKAIDLFIISDVASPFMDAFVRTEEREIKGWRNLSFRSFLWIGLTLLLSGAVVTFFGFKTGSSAIAWISGAFAALLFLGGFVSLFLSNLFNWMMKTFHVPEFFLKRLGLFSTLKFGIYETLLKNRISSVVSMVSEVFMKQIRRRQYDRVYNTEGWATRLIMNAVYELTPQYTAYRNSVKKDIISPGLQNISPALMAAAERAKSMGTTLWFTPEELRGEKQNMLNTLVASGQATACFNILEYVEKVLKSKEYAAEYGAYSPEVKSAIDGLYQRMMEDWKKFNADPFWMIQA